MFFEINVFQGPCSSGSKVRVHVLEWVQVFQGLGATVRVQGSGPDFRRTSRNKVVIKSKVLLEKINLVLSFFLKKISSLEKSKTKQSQLTGLLLVKVKQGSQSQVLIIFTFSFPFQFFLGLRLVNFHVSDLPGKIF